MTDADPFLLALCAAAIGGGLLLLWRGFGGYQAAVRVGDTSTSRIASLAAGEVRITGVIEPAEVTITSRLQGRECVWYRSRVTASGDDNRRIVDEERAVGFRVSDGTGSIRVFPRGARVDAPVRLDERDSALGDPPPSVTMRPASTFDTRITGDREAAIAALLTVRLPAPDDDVDSVGSGERGRRYEESRLEVGDTVTVVGTALPFGHLDDPDGADHLDRLGDPLLALDDPEVAMNIAEAREAGILTTPEEAWGNAAIPGFGIGRPVREPEIDPHATEPVLASPEEAARIERVFDLEPDLLVLAVGPDTPLLVAHGTPGDVVAREEGRFLLGLIGGILAIAGAIGAAVLLAGPA
jgi:hypothetical protein